MPKVPERSLEQPEADNSPGGPKIGFTEQLSTNLTILRDNLKTRKLRVRYVDVGSEARTRVAICYVAGVVDTTILEGVTKQIKGIDVKYVPNKKVVTDSLHVPYSWVFPTEHLTERFDEFISDLMQGRVGIIVDKNPYGVITPAFFFEHFHGPDDYFVEVGRFSNRLWRILGFMLAVFLPALFIAVGVHHPVWYPAAYVGAGKHLALIWQVVILLVIYRNVIDIVFRLSLSLVFFISVIMGNVIGSMTVEAKFLDSITIVVVSLSALAGLQNSHRLGMLTSNVRWMMLPVAYYFDWWGMCILTALLFIYAALIRVWGIPYMRPYLPLNIKDVASDSIFIRGNLRKIINKPHKYRR